MSNLPSLAAIQAMPDGPEKQQALLDAVAAQLSHPPGLFAPTDPNNRFRDLGPAMAPADPFAGKPVQEKVAFAGAVALAGALAVKKKPAREWPAMRRHHSKMTLRMAQKGWIQIDEPSARIFWRLRVPLVIVSARAPVPPGRPAAMTPRVPFDRAVRHVRDPYYFVWCEELIAYQEKILGALQKR